MKAQLVIVEGPDSGRSKELADGESCVVGRGQASGFQGESMIEVVKRIGVSGMLDWRYAYRVGVHIGRALDEAFQHQVIHRNLTPQNILFRTADKVAKLSDLTLAKALDGTLSRQVTRC